MSATDSGDTSWLLTSCGLVALMVPALALFYGGLVGPTAVVNTMSLSFTCLSVISLVWSLYGYTLAFAPGASDALDPWVGGDHWGAFDAPDRTRAGTRVPEHAFFLFQLLFATITAAVVSGGGVQRMTLWAWALWSALWVTLVYVPLARWIFYPNGWLAAWGVLDFAGGLVVETASGVSAFVLAYLLGPGVAPGHGAHNVPFVLLGTGLLWIGWWVVARAGGGVACARAWLYVRGRRRAGAAQPQLRAAVAPRRACAHTRGAGALAAHRAARRLYPQVWLQRRLRHCLGLLVGARVHQHAPRRVLGHGSLEPHGGCVVGVVRFESRGAKSKTPPKNRPNFFF